MMTSQLSLCAQDVRNNDHDQFLCALFVPEKTRQAIFALHVLHTETLRIRSLVSESQLGLMRLQWWRDLVEGTYQQKQDGSESGTHKEIIESLKNTQIKSKMFDRYFDARAFDMEDRAPDDLESLLQYCRETGGELAQMKAVILGAEKPESLKAAELIGTAATLCDIIKTLPYQARSGRTKLPKGLVLKHDVNIKDFFDFKSNTALKSCVNEMVTQIRKNIADARALRQEVEKNALPVFWMTVAVEDYLKRLEKVGCDPFNPHIGGGRLKKQLKLAYFAWRRKY